MKKSNPQTIEDFKDAAAKNLDMTTLDYFNGGSGREATLQSNVSSFHSFFLKPQIFSIKESPNCSTTVQGRAISLPLCIAPTAFHKLADAKGEMATFCAARKVDTIYVISCLSTTSLHAFSKESGLENVWVQLLTFKNRSMMFDIIKNAEKLGCGAIVITVDAPISGNRKKDTANRFQLPKHMRMEILHDHHLLQEEVHHEGSMLDTFFEKYVDPHFTWEDIREIAKSTHLPIILKGILRLEDAEKAIENGAKGIIISNHGGRQLDEAVPSMFALEEISSRLKTDIEIYVDGGFRTGIDLFKALSLGARAVFIGRPILWGLAANGEEGVEAVLNIFKKELIHTMHLCGISKINEINSNFIWRR